MEPQQLNEAIVCTILKHIPQYINPSSYIMKLLGISRESVYRRLRNEITFSIEELAILAQNLGFSVDEILIGQRDENNTFDLLSQPKDETSNAFLAHFYEYNNHIKQLIDFRNPETLLALNQMPSIFYVLSEPLLKLQYYLWLINNNRLPEQTTFTNLILPKELTAIQAEALKNIRKVTNVSIVFSSTIYLQLIKTIQYYYNLKLLSEEELIALKQAVHAWINLGEGMARFGFGRGRSMVDFYISSLFVNTNIFLIANDGRYEVHYWIYPNHPLVIRNEHICALTNEWFMELRKHSSLITQSNEIIQAEFYEKQRQYIESYLVMDDTPSTSF
jgi:transcriptional regulator with XRE-family HTH domain